MRIAVLSDTHGNAWALEACVRAAGHVDAWLFLGDNTRDTAALEATGAAVYAVRGNTDLGAAYPVERVVELGGKRIFLCHGHTYGVNGGLTRLALRARELGCQAALFGHTHIPFLDETGPVVLLNPGSPTRPRGGSKRCMGLLRIAGEALDAELMPLP